MGTNFGCLERDQQPMKVSFASKFQEKITRVKEEHEKIYSLIPKKKDFHAHYKFVPHKK